MKIRKLDDKANMGTVILAVATAVTIAISIVIIYSVMGGINTVTVDTTLGAALGHNTSLFRDATNASSSLITGLGTFFTLAPIYIIVLIAVAIIGAVMGIMLVRRSKQ